MGLVRGIEQLREAERAARAEAEAARARLAEQNERLLELDRLKDEFVSSITHDLRTPLVSIAGFLELLLADEPGSATAEQRRFLELVDRNAARLLAMVDDLLLAAALRADWRSS